MAASLRERVLEHIRERGLFSEPGLALLAISGGADSVAMLDLIAGLATELGLDLAVAHVDHGISRESSAVADSVKTIALRYDVPCHVAVLELGAAASETEARNARYRELRRLQRELGARYLVTAHQLDDQAETVQGSLGSRSVDPRDSFGRCSHSDAMNSRHGPAVEDRTESRFLCTAIQPTRIPDTIGRGCATISGPSRLRGSVTGSPTACRTLPVRLGVSERLGRRCCARGQNSPFVPSRTPQRLLGFRCKGMITCCQRPCCALSPERSGVCLGQSGLAAFSSCFGPARVAASWSWERGGRRSAPSTACAYSAHRRVRNFRVRPSETVVKALCAGAAGSSRGSRGPRGE
jgi:tRNA(Ile)-lysidine synthetase-like protein